MYKRMISLLLCLVMVCSLLPVGVFAEEEILEGIVPEAEVESFDAPVPVPKENNAVTSIEIPFRINPLYAGQISVAEPAREGESAALFAAPVYGTVAEGKATLREGMKARMPQVKVYVSTTEEDLSAVFYEMFYGAMEHNGDPAAGDYLKYQYAGYGGSVEWDWDNNVIFTYDLAYCDTPEQQDVMDSAVATLLGQLNLYGKSDYEKICGIYDWMCANITYDYDNLEDDSYHLMYTAYAALVNRTAVCQGYANLFYRLALELGVDSRIISGTGISNTGSGPHAWNIVKLSGSYYDVDATWDATWKQAGLEYDWFLKNEAEFSQDHVRAADFTTAAFQNAYPMATEDYTPPVPETPNYVDQGTCGDNLAWTLDEGGVLNIRGTGDMYDYSGDVETPWSEYWDIIETVNIENGVTSIGDFAFWGNSAMTEVNIPDSVTRIGVGAFSDCGSLTGVEIPDSVTGIGAYAFSPCISLTEILVDEDNPNYSSDAYGVLFNKDKTTLICCPAGKTGEYKIPDSVTGISDYAFESCVGLTSVEIGSSVTDIGTWGFGYCINLAEITFKGSAPAFSDDAFEMVTDATAYYPAGNDTWTEAVMQDYGGTITWVAYADGMAKIGDVAYATVADALEAAEVGDTVTLLQNAEEDTVTVRKGITLDLNSYALTADYVFAVNGSNIADNSSDNTGVLVVNPDHMMINSGNAHLPIWNGEGFIFVDILYFQELYTTNEAGQKQYVFLPSFETIAHQYLVQGMENSHVKIAIRMTWEIETGSAFQNFVYNDETVKAVISSYDGSYYEKVFYATITNSEYADFDLKVVLISDTGVELMLN